MHTRLRTLILASTAAAMLPVGLSAQTGDLRLPVVIDAERTDYDGNTSMLMFTGLKLTQGTIGIEADEARASRMDFDDSVWRFSGNVVFDVDDSRVTCEAADLEFSDFQLQKATITGSPATYEFRRQGSDEVTYAEAGRLYYDFVAGTIEFSGGATIIEGGNQISSETLVYNIRERRIAASGNGADRVKITYTPESPPRFGEPDTQEQDDVPGAPDSPGADDTETGTDEDDSGDVGS